MRAVVTIATLVLLASQAGATTLATHALVELVPPVEAALVSPVAADGGTVWRVEGAPEAPWQVNLETRGLDGRVLEIRAAMPGDSPAGGQDLTTFTGPAAARTAEPVVLTLVLCRE